MVQIHRMWIVLTPCMQIDVFVCSEMEEEEIGVAKMLLGSKEKLCIQTVDKYLQDKKLPEALTGTVCIV